ncbi:MAG: hypothetical protein IJB66_00095 [Oscillospiraceae bacterium]|nr:hypothetical protein [Oscillospiraceae bacterium]
MFCSCAAAEPEAEQPKSENEKADEWGVTLSVKNVTPESATIVFNQSGGNPTGELMTGSYFRIENENGELAFIAEGDITWTAEAYNIPESGELEMEVNWEGVYGTLEPGTYRIFKNVRNNSDPGDLIKEGSVEFTVE